MCSVFDSSLSNLSQWSNFSFFWRKKSLFSRISTLIIIYDVQKLEKILSYLVSLSFFSHAVACWKLWHEFFFVVCLLLTRQGKESLSKEEKLKVLAATRTSTTAVYPYNIFFLCNHHPHHWAKLRRENISSCNLIQNR